MKNKCSELDIHKVLALIPHRYPFIMVDRIDSFVVGETITCLKNVTINEPFFQGHFPGEPVMPGVMVLEALAQASGLLYLLTHEPGHDRHLIHYLAGAEKVRFRKVVLPGDQLSLLATFIKAKRDIWKLDCVAKVAGQTVCTAELTLANKEVSR
jgi:3-hydroxyacyl-[acyl-carrier-protein] dehydratase